MRSLLLAVISNMLWFAASRLDLENMRPGLTNILSKETTIFHRDIPLSCFMVKSTWFLFGVYVFSLCFGLVVVPEPG